MVRLQPESHHCLYVLYCCFRPAWQCLSNSIELILKKLFARIQENLFFRAAISKLRFQVENILNCKFSSECRTPEWDLDCLVYMLYTLEFCVFIQAIWPLDATFFIYLISCFNRSSKAGFKRVPYTELQVVYCMRFAWNMKPPKGKRKSRWRNEVRTNSKIFPRKKWEFERFDYFEKDSS